MAPHSSTVARKIPWMEETGRLYVPWRLPGTMSPHLLSSDLQHLTPWEHRSHPTNGDPSLKCKPQDGEESVLRRLTTARNLL